MPKEIWKDVPGYEGLYQVSSIGRVRSYINNRWGITKTPHILRATKTSQGYIVVQASYKGKQLCPKPLHRLMALAFLPNPEGKCDVNHINGIKDDNRLENLEWATRSENMKHAAHVLHGNFGNRKPVRCKETGKVYESARAAARELRCNPSQISGVIYKRGRIKTAAGYTWEFVDKSDIIKRKEDKMPIKRVKGGWKYGQTGKVYKNKAGAVKQARAIIISQKKAGKKVK